ncbi:MAG: hypothetical protein JEZ01_12885 [Labilibaculum sp.]|nr:hypothetical protein [Labilibaculum sp.]MBI9058653.1 hypothetical protein [Labilibaculum sp.]
MSKVKLYNSKGSYLFAADPSKEIDRGGEGSIINHPKNSDQVLKLYHLGIKPSLSIESWNYLKQLGSRFIKPNELLFDKRGDLVGFSMDLLDKKFFRISQIYTKSQCTKLGVSDTVKNKISKELISVVKEAHAKQIVLGDFNPYNIFINKLGDIQIIDVDSFETPVHEHSGRLLDEVRDHYYLGRVSEMSDYYAVAVNVFRLFTYLHPYKGIHKSWKSLEERAIKQISVLGDVTDLIIPAFYEPIKDHYLEDQFKQIFNSKNRFLIHIDQVSTIKRVPLSKMTTRDNLHVKILASNVVDFYFNESAGYIKTDEFTDLFLCDYIGSLSLTERVANSEYDFLWVGNKNILKVKENVITLRKEKIRNFEFPENFKFVQIDHLVVGVDWENIYYFNPDKVVNENIAWNKVNSWGRGFKFDPSPIQFTGGVARTHFRTGDTINSIKLPLHAKTLNLKGNIGVISYLGGDKTKYNWAIINGLHLEVGKETDEILSFAVKQSGTTNYIFVPKDGKIDILRSSDFETIDSINFEEATSQSQLFITKSGLLLLENQVLYLINRNS